MAPVTACSRSASANTTKGAVSFGDRLAHLKRHERGEVVATLLQQVEGPAQNLGARPGGCGRPRLCCRHGSLERTLAIGTGCVLNLLEHRDYTLVDQISRQMWGALPPPRA